MAPVGSATTAEMIVIPRLKHSFRDQVGRAEKTNDTVRPARLQKFAHDGIDQRDVVRTPRLAKAESIGEQGRAVQRCVVTYGNQRPSPNIAGEEVSEEQRLSST